MTKFRGSIAAIAAACLAPVGSATAQGYPDHIIEMIVPSTPGSSADILGRILGDNMGSQLGQRFIVLNKAGASSILGTAEVARAKPDGYTLMHSAVFSITVQPLTERQTGYTAQSF
jgi:tripartite-type tricarboxylate transporter receptor subunit TctC